MELSPGTPQPHLHIRIIGEGPLPMSALRDRDAFTSQSVLFYLYLKTT